MKKKTTEISVNTSSGAEKVENIEKEIKKEGGEKTTAKKTVTSTAQKNAQGSPKTEKTTVEKKTEKENKAADERVKAALKRKEAQARRKAAKKELAAKKAEARKKKLAEKQAMIEKRKAEKKAKAEKHAAERKALAEKRAAEKEQKLRERAHAKANRNNAQSKKKASRSQKRENNKEKNKDRNKGYGGWIAAVVSLGVVSLALATTVTVGAMEMRKGRDALMGSYKSTMYELTGIMENVDSDLDRIRVSASPAQQSRILTDLLVQARLAELDVEKLPVSAESDRNVSVFVNRTAAECERMLSKLRNGEQLNDRDRAILEELYRKNHAMREELGKLLEGMTDKDLMEYVKDGAGSIKSALERLEQTTIEENMNKVEKKVEEGKDKLEEGKDKIEKKIKEMTGAGTQSSKPVNGEKPHIEAAKAESLCAQYFAGYNIAEFQCIGETVTNGYAAYNVQGYDDRGNQLFAEVSQADGALLRFDYYEDCMDETFDIRNAELIAEEFLEKLGYDDMEAVRVRANGSMSDFTFVYEDDDVVYYPDEIRVKVCRTRGVVSGFDATKYLQNHKGRDELKVNLTLADAYGKLYKELSVESSRLALVKTVRGERPAYEFLCSYGDENYFVFLDALNGEEISILNVKSAQ